MLLSFGFTFRMGRRRPTVPDITAESDPEGLWDYVTQGLKITTDRRRELARVTYYLGVEQLTADCFNLEDELAQARSEYHDVIVGLHSEDVERIVDLSGEAVVVRSRGKSGYAEIDEK